MAADALAAEGDRASAGMVLIKYFEFSAADF